MRNMLLGGVALVLTAAGPMAREPIAIAGGAMRSDTFPALEARYPGGILARPHVEFANYVGYRPLYLDLYLHHDARPRPLIVWIHGGGWSRGDARQSGAFADWPAVLAQVAARGFTVAAIDYRLSGEAAFPAQIADVKAAIRFLRANSGAYGIDPERVLVWGGSAGGHLAALAATSCGASEYTPAPSSGRMSRSQAATARALPQSDCIQGAAVWYGALDLAGYGESDSAPNVAALLRCAGRTCDIPARAASPIHRVDARTPPMLLVHGTADEEVPFSQSQAMAAQMRAAARPVELELIEGVGHGFIGPDVAATRRASLHALERTLVWFDAVSAITTVSAR